MTRVNTNSLALRVQQSLVSAGVSLSHSLERLSTGLRINRGADDPAGMIASERLRAEIASLNASMSNTARAANIVGTAEGGLGEINDLLIEIQGLVDESANSGGMTSTELAANQLLIDEAVASIDRIAGTTQFSGQRLLDGTAGFATRGVDTGELASVNVLAATVDEGGRAIGYDVDATTAARAAVTMDSADIASAEGSVAIGGNLGSESVTFTVGMTQAEIIDAVNAVQDSTGVVAAAQGADIVFRSAEYGDEQFVSFALASGATFDLSATEDYGADATVSSVDGSSAGVTVEGLTVLVNRSGLQLELTLADATVVQGAGSFTIDEPPLVFQIAPLVAGAAGRVSIGIANMASSGLGDAISGRLSSLVSGGENDLSSGRFEAAAGIVASAIEQVGGMRGRLGAAQQSTFESAANTLGVTRAHAMAAESAIRDTDFAVETANLMRARILFQAGASLLAMANLMPENALRLFER